MIGYTYRYSELSFDAAYPGGTNSGTVYPAETVSITGRNHGYVGADFLIIPDTSLDLIGFGATAGFGIYENKEQKAGHYIYQITNPYLGMGWFGLYVQLQYPIRLGGLAITPHVDFEADLNGAYPFWLRGGLSLFSSSLLTRDSVAGSSSFYLTVSYGLAVFPLNPAEDEAARYDLWGQDRQPDIPVISNSRKFFITLTLGLGTHPGETRKYQVLL